MYAGMHFAKRNRLASDAHWLIVSCLDPHWQPFDCVVDIYIMATYHGNPVDADNIVSKIYIDGLKSHVIHDDDRKHVRRVTTEAVLGSEDSVTIIVTPVE